MHDEFILELSTTVAPAKQFTVDGKIYEMFTGAHLSPGQEAHINALFSQHIRLSRRLAAATSIKKGELLAAHLRDIRIRLISTMTTLTYDEASALPMPAQVSLLNSIQRNMESADGVEDDGAEDEDEDEDEAEGTEEEEEGLDGGDEG
jgi:hypothetical protein